MFVNNDLSLMVKVGFERNLLVMINSIMDNLPLINNTVPSFESRKGNKQYNIRSSKF